MWDGNLLGGIPGCLPEEMGEAFSDDIGGLGFVPMGDKPDTLARYVTSDAATREDAWRFAAGVWSEDDAAAFARQVVNKDFAGQLELFLSNPRAILEVLSASLSTDENVPMFPPQVVAAAVVTAFTPMSALSPSEANCLTYLAARVLVRYGIQPHGSATATARAKQMAETFTYGTLDPYQCETRLNPHARTRYWERILARHASYIGLAERRDEAKSYRETLDKVAWAMGILSSIDVALMDTGHFTTQTDTPKKAASVLFPCPTDKKRCPKMDWLVALFRNAVMQRRIDAKNTSYAPPLKKRFLSITPFKNAFHKGDEHKKREMARWTRLLFQGSPPTRKYQNQTEDMETVLAQAIELGLQTSGYTTPVMPLSWEMLVQRMFDFSAGVHQNDDGMITDIDPPHAEVVDYVSGLTAIGGKRFEALTTLGQQRVHLSVWLDETLRGDYPPTSMASRIEVFQALIESGRKDVFSFRPLWDDAISPDYRKGLRAVMQDIVATAQDSGEAWRVLEAAAAVSSIVRKLGDMARSSPAAEKAWAQTAIRALREAIGPNNVMRAFVDVFRESPYLALRVLMTAPDMTDLMPDSILARGIRHLVDYWKPFTGHGRHTVHKTAWRIPSKDYGDVPYLFAPLFVDALFKFSNRARPGYRAWVTMLANNQNSQLLDDNPDAVIDILQNWDTYARELFVEMTAELAGIVDEDTAIRLQPISIPADFDADAEEDATDDPRQLEDAMREFVESLLYDEW